MTLKPRIWLHSDDHGTRRVIDPRDILFIEALAGDTLIHLRHAKRPLVDIRPFAKLLLLLAPYAVIRIHKHHAVNLLHIEQIRRRSTRDLELRLTTKPARTLRIGRPYLSELAAHFGE